MRVDHHLHRKTAHANAFSNDWIRVHRVKSTQVDAGQVRVIDFLLRGNYQSVECVSSFASELSRRTGAQPLHSHFYDSAEFFTRFFFSFYFTLDRMEIGCLLARREAGIGKVSVRCSRRRILSLIHFKCVELRNVTHIRVYNVRAYPLIAI